MAQCRTTVSLAAWNNQSSDIWFRIAALDGTTGSGSRNVFAIDDFDLSYSAMPEPVNVALGIFGGMMGILAFARSMRAKRHFGEKTEVLKTES